MIDYSKDRGEKESSTFELRGRCVLAIKKNIGDGIDNLLEHLPLPKEQIFDIRKMDE